MLHFYLQLHITGMVQADLSVAVMMMPACVAHQRY